ncbi:MAG: acetylesterase [Sphingomonas bacterium]|uniref:alpha/beta hydrolase n=1 Tax=Sphingomonas bacterium TaxID=1895847 RepID=UPI002605FFD7|nr:alpha/beta hydrolase [Sphingomonas bacterium]MDB5708790.1 acetylesterase [Sphingomonas bacterium]
MTVSPIDPEIQFFVDGIAAAYAQHPDVMTVPPAEARAIVEQVRAPWRQGGPVMQATEERTIALPGGTIRARIHRPTDARGRPVLIYLHGGGFTFFSIDTHDRLMREYAAASGMTVIGLAYPLSPEVKFPEALHRIAAFVTWLASDASDLEIDRARIAIGGDSAGGNLSLATALLLRERGAPGLVKALLLNYPGLSPDKSPEAVAQFGGEGAILSADEAEFFWNNYLRGPDDRRDPLANLLIADPAGLPPALFVVAEHDLIAEQSDAMATRIEAAGGAAELRLYSGAVHGFVEAMSVSALARRAVAESAQWLVATMATR